MIKHIKNIGLAVCLMAVLAVSFSACNKYEKIILGSWEQLDSNGDGTGIIWTFQKDHTLLLMGSRCYYSCVDNTLILYGNDREVNFLILEINDSRMVLSGNLGVWTLLRTK